MKRLVAAIMTILIILPFCFIVSAETYVPSRTINLVYDDSGSMIRVGSTYVDTWCQAKYAIEVFAGMLGENETLNIYYMSDYVKDLKSPPKLSLKGSKDAAVTEANVKKIHDLVTDASETPFNSVKKAYEDLKKATSDERWLVVLTDGEFNSTSNERVENYFHECVSDGKTRVMMLSMGPNAAVITPNPDKHIYFEKAENTTDILSKLTKICNRIFQSNALDIDEKTNEVTFNVPMSQLVVFAQGKSVKIKGLTTPDGETIKTSSNVHVQYSKKATIDKNYPERKVVVADNLNGYVATYNMDFKPGTYKVDVSGADDIQVYYKPNVSIAAYLFNDDNEEVTAKDNLVSGTYRLEFGFIDATNGKKVTDTSLLGDILYTATIVNTDKNGEKTEIQAEMGDPITIKEGTIDIDVTAKFLEYNTVNANLSYQIYASNDLIFTLDKKPSYTLSKDGFGNPDEPMVMSVKIDSGDGIVALTEEQWELLGIPEVTTTADLGKFRVEKTEEIGKYNIYPTLKDNDPMQTAEGSVPITIKGSFKQGLSSASGKLEDSFEITSSITFMERVTDWLKENWLKLTISLLILLLILGYVPPFKKYLPRKIKNKPYIKCMAIKIGVHDLDAKGTYKRNLSSTLIPYKAETGSLTFTPPPRKVLKLKAAGKNRMLVTNTRSFAGKSEITFDGVSVPKDEKKPIHIGSSSILSAKTVEYNYICYLNR